jgi:hypothetical protein
VDSVALRFPESGGRGTVGSVGLMLRWAALVHLLAVFTQPVLAGRFLSGDYPMLYLHWLVAIALVSASGLQVVLAAVFRKVGGAGWPLRAAARILVLEGLQFYLGLHRILGLHVPLGVALAVWVTTFTTRLWREPIGPGAASARPDGEATRPSPSREPTPPDDGAARPDGSRPDEGL